MSAKASHKFWPDEYESLTEEEIVRKAQAGDDAAVEYLLNKYRNYVRSKTRTYFLVGAEREDIFQEGMIGLYKAIRDFDAQKIISFRAFAELCIMRQIITAIKAATRQKHNPLNSYISLNKPVFEEESDRTLLDVADLAGGPSGDPEELFLNKEDFRDIQRKMGESLSSLERKVLLDYLNGKSYQEIAAELHRHVKSIDNAIQRIKRKLDLYLQRRNKIQRSWR